MASVLQPGLGEIKLVFFQILNFCLIFSYLVIPKENVMLHSTRVSNELGADRPDKAKSAMIVTLKLCGLLALIIILALAFGHNIWAGLFSDSPVIINSFASMTPLLAISIAVDSFQGILSG